MRSLLHTARMRRNVLFLFVITILSLAGFVKLISYNNEKRQKGEAALQLSHQLIQNTESIRALLGETESYIQSFMLTGDDQWKNSLSTAHARLLKMLNETASLESDPMQQQKLSLVRHAIEQKIAFQQTVINADSVSPALTTAMSFHGLNRRLTLRIQSPLSLIGERQQLLLQRKTEQIRSTAAHAKFITIFLAVFVYLLILVALWHLRNQVQPGPAAKIDMEDDDAVELTDHNRQNTGNQSGFRGVFSISDEKDDRIRRQEGTGIVRVLWSKAELEENFGYLSAKMEQLEQAKLPSSGSNEVAELITEEAVPEWKVAGLPEQLSLQFDKGNDHFLGHAVNANYYQAGPLYNRLPNNYIPGGPSMYRVLPAPEVSGKETVRLSSQDSPAFDLAAMITDVLHPFHVPAEDKNIRLLHTIDPAIPNFLSGDEKKLRNILHCVLENAMRFTYKGYIQLTIRGINISNGFAEIAFSVADTGRGLDAEQLNDLLHGSGSKVPALYHAKKLAESQQSQLMIHSTEEDGTVCCFIASYRF